MLDLIDGERWMAIDADVKGDAYEGLLERNAADTKSGAGQYFTPRALISAIVDVMRPGPDMRICDPACGTGGFFLAAYDYILRHHRHLDPMQRQHLRSGLFTGWEIVDNTARLCAMNLLLHGIESHADLDDFVACYQPAARHQRTESERFRRFTYDELLARDKVSLDLFWLRDESLDDTDNLPSPGVIAAEIVEDLQAALAEFAALADSLQAIPDPPELIHALGGNPRSMGLRAPREPLTQPPRARSMLLIFCTSR